MNPACMPGARPDHGFLSVGLSFGSLIRDPNIITEYSQGPIAERPGKVGPVNGCPPCRPKAEKSSFLGTPSFWSLIQSQHAHDSEECYMSSAPGGWENLFFVVGELDIIIMIIS